MVSEHQIRSPGESRDLFVCIDRVERWVPAFAGTARLGWFRPGRVGRPARWETRNDIDEHRFSLRELVLGFQEDAVGIRLRDVIGTGNMMWSSDYPHSESTFPRSRQILAEILAGVSDDEQARIAGGNTARVYHFDMARLAVPV